MTLCVDHRRTEEAGTVGGLTVAIVPGRKPQMAGEVWRRGRDLNSRTPCEVSGFQDRHVRPLRHPSIPSFDPTHNNCRLTRGLFLVLSHSILLFFDPFDASQILP